jgi:pimeloyl-ACP methyl ester carboxylesterase/DNA-binding CsgD family transcriptional regulator
MNSLALISTIYSATLSPHRFHETADELEAQVITFVREITGIEDFGDVLPAGSGVEVPSAAREALSHHVENVLAIQARLYTEAPDSHSRIEAMLELIPNPAVLFNADEEIVRENQLAAQRHSAGTASLSTLFPAVQQRTQVRKALAMARQGADFLSQPLQFDAGRRENTCVLVKRLPDAAQGGETLFLVTIVDFGFADGVAEIFRETYRLTEAETEVAIKLAGGARPAEIANMRNVSLETVRAQIKSIKQKTGVRDIPDLVRLLCGFSVGILVPDRFPASSIRPAQTVFTPSTRSIRLADGRRMEYVVQGAPSGEPVILFHNMPYGHILPDAAIRAASAMGLTIYSPVRPGYRSSDPLAKARGEKWLNAVGRDTKEFMERMRISRARLLGNVAGGTFAIRFATLYPEAVSQILLVSRAPVWRSEWLKQLPANHRVMSMLMWLMPKMAEIFIRSIASYMKKHSAKSYIQTAAQGSEPDLKAIDNPEILHLMETGILEGLQQGSETFCKDWELMEIDLSAEAARLPHPIHIVHGEDDRIVNPEFSRCFVQAVPGAMLQMVPGAGHYLFYSHWRHVLNAVAGKA